MRVVAVGVPAVADSVVGEPVGSADGSVSVHPASGTLATPTAANTLRRFTATTRFPVGKCLVGPTGRTTASDRPDHGRVGHVLRRRTPPSSPTPRRDSRQTGSFEFQCVKYATDLTGSPPKVEAGTAAAWPEWRPDWGPDQPSHGGGEPMPEPVCECLFRTDWTVGQFPCGATGPNGLQCSRPRGHDGPHAACTAGRHPLYTWSTER